MPLWAKIDVDMPTDCKLLGQPVATRLLWLCLICLAKQQDDHGAIRGFDCGLIAGRFNIPRGAVAKALTHYQAQRMVELDPDGTIRLLNFEKRQGPDDTTNERAATYYAKHRDEVCEKRRAAREKVSRPAEPFSREESHGVLTESSHTFSRETLSLEQSREEVEKKDQKQLIIAQSAENQPPAPTSAFAAYVTAEWSDFKNAVAFEKRARAAFPAVDPLGEARKARGWELSDPRHRKVKHGAFLWGWLTTAQERASRNARNDPPPRRPGAANLHVDNEAHQNAVPGRKFI